MICLLLQWFRSWSHWRTGFDSQWKHWWRRSRHLRICKYDMLHSQDFKSNPNRSSKIDSSHSWDCKASYCKALTSLIREANLKTQMFGVYLIFPCIDILIQKKETLQRRSKDLNSHVQLECGSDNHINYLTSHFTLKVPWKSSLRYTMIVWRSN